MARFRPAGTPLIRAASRELDLPPWPDLAGHTADLVPQWRDWLARLWRDEDLAEAIELASPDLARAVRAVCDGHATSPRRVRRAVVAVTGYLLRMTSRATPFGLFAGVAPVQLAARTSVTWGPDHQVAVRPDPVWLDGAIRALEASPSVFRRLSMVLNNLSLVRDGTLVIACQPGGGTPGERGPSGVQLPISRPVAIVMDAAHLPVTVADLLGKLSAEFPHTAAPVLERMLRDLLACRVLIPDLCPPMHITDPLGHLIDRADAGAGPEKLTGDLRAIREDLAGYAQASTPRGRRAHQNLAAARMAAVSACPGPPLAVDLRLDLTVALPPPVLAEAAAAASALVRLAPYPHGTLPWQHWHGLFLERYGTGAVIPVTEAVNPDTGIGYPAGYRGSPHTTPPAPTSARDLALLRLAQQAALDNRQEILLEEPLLDLLAASTAIRQVVPHTELRFAVHAATPDAVDRGEFTLVITSAARQAGTSTGRFLHLLDAGQNQSAAQALTALPTLTDGAMITQISCPPLAVRAQHLTRTPRVFPVTPVAEYPCPGTGQIPLDDLAVTGDAHRLFLVSLASGRVIEPVQLNALEFRASTHPLARFLCELPVARAAPCIPFSWGAVAGMPFLPRIRYRRSILHPATWTITPPDLPGPDAAWPAWAASWERLRERLRIPRSVLLVRRDMRTGLDLEQTAHLAILRIRFERDGQATLIEGPGHDACAWIAGRPHEIALPLASTFPPGPPPAGLDQTGPVRATGHLAHTPGISRWLYARLNAHPDRHTAILSRHLPALLASWPGGTPAAWFLRYREPEPHLRLRIPLPDPGDFGPAARRVGTWAGQLRRAGLLSSLLLDTYYPETGRYGDGPVLHAAETVFAADSAAVIAQLTIVTADGLHPLAMTTAGLTDLATAFTGNIPAAMTWLTRHTTGQPARPPGRDLTAQTLHLADPETGRSALRSMRGGRRLLDAWDQRRNTVTAYHVQLTAAGAPDPDRALADLLHLHHVRMIGIDRDAERTCYHLARSVALSWTARHPGAHHLP